jgi:hypothetical protein
MIADPVYPVVALTIGLMAAFVWGCVLARSIGAWRRGYEHRASYVLMAGTAFIASLGTLASSIGFAMQRHLIPEFVPADFMSFLASVGRGALLMGGLIILTHYRPPKQDKP